MNKNQLKNCRIRSITAILCVSLLCEPALVRPARAGAGPALGCLLIGALVLGGYVVYRVTHCNKPWKCLHDADDPSIKSCAQMTARQAESAGLVWDGTNYPTQAACQLVCTNVTKGGVGGVPPPPAELNATLIIEGSADGLHWASVKSERVALANIEDLDVSFTNQIAAASAYFCRARLVPDAQ